MKNKTLSTWLALAGGPLGLHRFYLFGPLDVIGWALPIPTALGLYGIMRALVLGLDDKLSWLLIPLLGFVIAGCCMTAIFYGLMSEEKWNARYGKDRPETGSTQTSAGQSNWLTIVAVVASLMVGATALMGALAYSFQRYFEWQIELARQISQ
jgi:hypothetical protein